MRKHLKSVKKGNEMDQDQKFVEDIIKAIVDTPENVKTDRTIDERGVLIKLYVDPSDMGKVIGKDGKTAKAVRTLLRVIGAKNNARLNLKIVEPDGGDAEDGDSRDRRSYDEEKVAAPTKPTKTATIDDIPNDVLA